MRVSVTDLTKHTSPWLSAIILAFWPKLKRVELVFPRSNGGVTTHFGSPASTQRTRKIIANQYLDGFVVHFSHSR